MFVTEIIPREEVEAKALPIISRYKSYISSEDIIKSRQVWTIDRGKDVYLIFVKKGREEFNGQSTFVLYKSGDLIEFILETDPNQPDFVDRMVIRWKLLSSKKIESDKKVEVNEVGLLKDALKARGFHGRHSMTTVSGQKISVQVEFLF